MGQKTKARYGAWESPLSAAVAAGSSVRLGEIRTDGEDVYWIEGRPAEKGRNALVRRCGDGSVEEVAPGPFNVRSQVHEYGGGAYAVAGRMVFFVNFSDRRIYRVGGEVQTPVPVTPESTARYADLQVENGRMSVVCVREEHGKDGRSVRNDLVRVHVEKGGGIDVLAACRDFYSSPRISPCGRRIAWLEWDHPAMPWDGCELVVGELSGDGSIASARKAAGGRAESIFQPEWGPDGTLYFVSDAGGWWNLWRLDGRGRPECVLETTAEFGRPQWVFGMSTYAFTGSGITCAYCTDGLWKLGMLDPSTGQFSDLAVEYTSIDSVRAGGGRIYFTGASPRQAPSVIEYDPESGSVAVLKRSSGVVLDDGYVSLPKAVTYPGSGGGDAHAFYYAPANGGFEGDADELPPLIVKSHGGPTGAAECTFNPGIQFWTTRGFAVLDVNYGGSTGYGREYREKLKGKWGIVDVQDCASGALCLAGQGLVDGKRLIITGGSAGGYTTLSALAFTNVFHAGASYYGVSDLEALATETHKFESHYLDSLVGTYPEQREVYIRRSPVHNVEGLSCPVIFFQGLEDRIVPPNQARMMADSLRRKGVPVAHVEYGGEQHGFRRAANIERSLEAELYFYGRIFGFQPAGGIEPVEIVNLPG
ncbi:MAG: S9 family peptidase [Planctomycetes bacterium]|nr:S9 family peptidase [Planctomycetota bacterium]